MRNETPFIEVEGLRFLNVPSAQAVIDEIFRDDCYRISEIPNGCTVFDVGAFYGEFGIYMAAKKGCLVFAFEPAPLNFDIAKQNLENNSNVHNLLSYSLSPSPITGNGQKVGIFYRPDHPAGSQVNELEFAGDVQSIRLSELVKNKPRPICVKLDCEGAEVGIFRDDPSWIEQVDFITMEWHNHDGHLYKNELLKRGFKVELCGGGPLPKPAWEFGMTGGLLFSKR